MSDGLDRKRPFTFFKGLNGAVGKFKIKNNNMMIEKKQK
jgi:hypothetical protein